MAFESEAVTVPRVRSRHRHQEVREVIPADTLQLWHADHEGTVASFATEAKAL
jgi:hypothetical protein